MKRFVGVLALVVAAAAVYVAMASGGQQAGPTAKQFAALKKTVTKLQKQVKAANTAANFAAGFVLTCVANKPVGVDSTGTTTTGFLFGTPPVGQGSANVASQALPALTVAPSTESSPPYRFFVLNTTNSACVSIVNGSASTTAMRLFAFKHH
jgi:hypothetical protein